MYMVFCAFLALLHASRVESTCTYSFVVNEVDPTHCPCLLEQPVNHDHGHNNNQQKKGVMNLSAATKLQQVQDDSRVSGGGRNEEEDLNSVLYHQEGSTLEKELNDEDIVVTEQKTPPVNSAAAILQAQFDKLRNNMKDLEIKVYQESVENRELKNLVIRQEQSVKDYKYLVERMKHSLTKQKVTVSKEKGLLQDEISTVKNSLEVMKDTLHKQDYYLKNLEKHTQDLRMQLNPGLSPPTSSGGLGTKMHDRRTKVIPVRTTAKVLCDGISTNATKYKDCDELFQRGHKLSGVYYITPSFTPCPIPVYCKMDGTAGWLVIQRRIDGTLNFNRKWVEYRDGFGDLNHEFWLGNNNIFLLTNQASYRLRIDMWDFNNTHRYAEYLYFTIAGERDKYRLFIRNYTGTAKDGLTRQSGMMFSTSDEDNDTWEDYHCGREWAGGWWYNNCWFVILNGKYYHTPKIKFRGISWNDWKAEQLKRVEMMISPSDYL